MIHQTLNWIHGTWPGQLVRNVFWLSPTLEILHFVGMALLVGGVSVVDARVLGLMSEVPLDRFKVFLLWALAGFALNLISGAMLFAAAPDAFAFNTAFRVKLICISLAGLNALWFRHAVFSDVLRFSSVTYHRRLAKIISCFSLILWLAVIACARLIPFVAN